jgi:hypothetical protein
MPKTKVKPYSQPVLDLMAETSGFIMKAQALVSMGKPELALSGWLAAIVPAPPLSELPTFRLLPLPMDPSWCRTDGSRLDRIPASLTGSHGIPLTYRRSRIFRQSVLALDRGSAA